MSQTTEANAAPQRSQRRLQVSLSTLLLLMATLAIWFGLWRVRQQTERLQSRMPGLLSISRELAVPDPMRSAAVARNPQWLGESIWDIYLPAGDDYQVCLALEEVNDRGAAAPLRRARVAPGFSTLEVRYDTPQEESMVSVLVDDEVVIEEKRPPDWEPRKGSYGGSEIHRSEQFDPSQPMVLYRRRFRGRDGASPQAGEPTSGILVWVEPAGGRGDEASER